MTTQPTPLKRFKRRMRYQSRRLPFMALHYPELVALKDRYRGERCFLVGSGPSLAEQDLSKLAGEFVCTVNAAVRGAGSVLPNVAMHVVLDNNRYRRFAADFEALAQEHGIDHRFYNYTVRRYWNRLPRHYKKPSFVLNHPRSLGERGVPPGFMRDGISSGSTVLIGAAQICLWLGFRQLHILGCDLSYGEASGPYFYAMSALDKTHEADAKVQARRAEMHKVNGEFALFAEAIEPYGARVVNSGLGGHLDSIERVELSRL